MPDSLIASAVKSILLADRPAAIPAAVAIRAMDDADAQQRPELIAFCEDGTSPHNQLRQTTLVLRLRIRDDETTADEAKDWHAAAVDYFRRNPAALAATLRPHGIHLIKFTLGDYADNGIAGRATELDQRWKVWVRVGE
jgi:hypothetical protein